jgi:ABC-type sugar transport system permease subunit
MTYTSHRTSKAARRRATLARWRRLGFLAPTLILLGVFVYSPLVRVVKTSFTKWDGVSPPVSVGMANYRFLWGFGDFHRIVVNNLVLASGIAIWVALPFIVAIIIFNLRGVDTIRLALFVPALLPPVIVGGVFRLVLAERGPLNGALRSLGLGFLAAPWLDDDRLVLLSVIGMIAWAVLGTGVLFYSAGLAAIPDSHIEAATIEGARWWQMVWFVYRPALRPVTRFWTLLLTIGTVTSFFPWIFGLTQGGPGIASTTLDYEVYTTGIVNGQYGLGSAIAVITILFVACLLAVQAAFGRVRSVEA